jgi:hypothetical protein
MVREGGREGEEHAPENCRRTEGAPGREDGGFGACVRDGAMRRPEGLGLDLLLCGEEGESRRCGPEEEAEEEVRPQPVNVGPSLKS